MNSAHFAYDVVRPYRDGPRLQETGMFISSHIRKIVAVALAAAFTTALAGAAMAETQWEKDHPRRDQVNDRLANQNKRINKEVKEGELTKQQAKKLHKDDRQIRREERMMASQN